MTCEEAIGAIEAMIDREIDDDERLQLEAHLAGCESCRRETEERRAFSEKLRRDLNDAFGSAAPPARRIVFRPRRFPWARLAAVVLVGVAIGYVGSSTGFFRPATAEAREVATLSALRDAYEARGEELTAQLAQQATALDRRASRAPEGPVRDALAISVMNAATGLAAPEPLELPGEPRERARFIARLMDSPNWGKRGSAVLALQRLAPGDAPYMEDQSVILNGTNRTFTEIVARSLRATAEPAVTVEIGDGAMRLVQLRNAAVRVEAAGATPKVYGNLLDFRARDPETARKLQVRGVDGYFAVQGVLQRAPEVEGRFTAYLPAVVWSSQAADSPALVEALYVHAVMADGARAGRSLEEIERRGAEVIRHYGRTSRSPVSVQADPALVRRHLEALRRSDRARLLIARELLNDEVATLAHRVADMERRLECASKASAALDYVQAPK